MEVCDHNMVIKYSQYKIQANNNLFPSSSFFTTAHGQYLLKRFATRKGKLDITSYSVGR
jgi:hypothetical protein